MSLSTSAIVLGAIGVWVAQQSSPSVWDGVFSATQAERGRVVYERHCSRCHGDDLAARGGSPLAGEGFVRNWEARSVERLFRTIRDTMPPQSAGTLRESDALDVVAYVLERNGFPAGASELVPDAEALARIHIVGQAGPSPLRNGALVRVAGCLGQDADGAWLLTDATQPEVTTLDPEPATNRLSTSAPAQSARTIGLLNVFPNPSAHRGRTVQAKGFLVREPAGDRVNVVTWEALDSSCGR